MMIVMKSWFSGPRKYPLIISAVIVALFAGGWWLLDGVHVPVLMPSGEIANQQRDLFMLTVYLSAVVVIPVFVLLGWFAWQYREDNPKAKYQPEWSENKWLEIVWWGIPIVIIVALSIITYITSHSLDPYRPIESDKEAVSVQVVALQWKWLFIYPELGVATVNELTIPVDRPVHFTLSADAPMSAFWIPALGSQIYSMNAMSSQLNLIANYENTYKGYNTNINGEGYSKMVFDVHAVSEDKFEKWHTSHAASGHVLDQHHLAELTEPSIVSAPMYMRLDDDNLYNTIIMKYMGHGSEGGYESSGGHH